MTCLGCPAPSRERVFCAARGSAVTCALRLEQSDPMRRLHRAPPRHVFSGRRRAATCIGRAPLRRAAYSLSGAQAVQCILCPRAAADVSRLPVAEPPPRFCCPPLSRDMSRLLRTERRRREFSGSGAAPTRRRCPALSASMSSPSAGQAIRWRGRSAAPRAHVTAALGSAARCRDCATLSGDIAGVDRRSVGACRPLPAPRRRAVLRPPRPRRP